MYACTERVQPARLSPESAEDDAKQAFAKTTANELALIPVPVPWPGALALVPVPVPWSKGKGWVRVPPSAGSVHF